MWIIFLFLIIGILTCILALNLMMILYPIPENLIIPVKTDRPFIDAAEWESRAFGWYDENIG